MLLARTHLCIPKRNPSRTASFRNTRIRRASRKTPRLLITVEVYFIIPTTDFSPYFPLSLEDGIKPKAPSLLPFDLPCLKKSLSHPPSAVPKEGVGRAAEERVKIQLTAELNQAFLPGCKAWKHNVGIRQSVCVNTSFFLNWLGFMKF